MPAAVVNLGCPEGDDTHNVVSVLNGVNCQERRDGASKRVAGEDVL